MALQSGKRYTAKDLAKKFETSEKTIYRSIENLLSAGVPIISQQGKNGGFELLKESSITNSFFTINELGSIVSFLKTNNEKLNNCFSIDDRISQIFNDDIISNIDNQSKQMVIDTTLWGHSSHTRKLTENLKEYIAKNLKVEIDYLGKSQAPSSRIIHPYTLVYKSNSWYVYAFCETRNSFRLFKISKINNCSPLNQTFTPKNIDILSKPWNNDYQNSFEKIEIELVCDKSILTDITDWLENSSVITINKNNKIHIKGTALYSAGLIHKIIEYSNNIEVIKPKKLKDDLYNECSNICKIYENKSAAE